MDLSIQGSGGVETESFSDDQSSGHHESLPNINMNQHDVHELVEAMDNHGLPVLTPRSSNCGYLERCGRWLCAIPRDDVVALQQTSEYREFLAAFDKLGEVRDHKSYIHIMYSI